MVADVGTGVFTSVDLLLGEARWYRDGQQTLWFDEESSRAWAKALAMLVTVARLALM